MGQPVSWELAEGQNKGQLSLDTGAPESRDSPCAQEAQLQERLQGPWDPFTAPWLWPGLSLPRYLCGGLAHFFDALCPQTISTMVLNQHRCAFAGLTRISAFCSRYWTRSTLCTESRLMFTQAPWSRTEVEFLTQVRTQGPGDLGNLPRVPRSQ